VADNGEPRIEPASAPASTPPAAAAPDSAPPITAGPTDELTAGPEVGRRRSSRRWLIIGTIAVLFLLIIGYVVGGAAAAGGEVGRADSTLKTAVGHNNTIAATFKTDPFKDVNFDSDNPDLGAAKAAVATFKQQVSTWQAAVTSDRSALQRVRPDLAGSFLTVPEQSTINDRRHRVDAALSALSTAQKAIDIDNKRVAFLEAFLDALAGFVALGNAKDLAGVQAQLPTTGANLQKAAQLAQPPAIPPEISPMVKAMQQAVTHLQAMVTAVQANDEAGFNRATAALAADIKVMTSFDGDAVDKADKARFQPMLDSYNHDMKIAAGG